MVFQDSMCIIQRWLLGGGVCVCQGVWVGRQRASYCRGNRPWSCHVAGRCVAVVVGSATLA